MTRIVAGQAGGRRLAVPPQGTRPTSDRAREGLFNTLSVEFELSGARVLDLFAGSGAVGLEALSRGAAEAVLVESDRRACAVIEANIRTLGLAGATVRQASVAGYLTTGADGPFDLVFADPPYALAADAVAELLTRLAEDRWLRPGAVLVLERSARDPQPAWPATIAALKHRRYGEGCLWYGRRTSKTMPESQR
ncbi:MAG TPA: 16S rRNA (guanine(966)-N(2))-methyltransferase RsmD [Jatrophihabitans sp.]|nr:16S rRNA (guanine(966)-N(2))-methyltransferase RsmD [Jatrophihabitans sp.]